MMNKQKTGKAWSWKVATFLPLLALLLMAFGRMGEITYENKIPIESVNSLISKLENDNKNNTEEIISAYSDTITSRNNINKDYENKVLNEEQTNLIKQKIIKGKVIDEYGNALEGVIVAGSKTMKTKTDINGDFELDMTEDVPLWFSHAGLRTTARTPPELEESTIVKMESDISNLGMGISIGYFKRETSSKETTISPAIKYNEAEDDKNKRIYSVVDQMPEFPGGTIALSNFITKQIKYPKIAAEDKAYGEVVVNFVINREGRVWYAKVVKSVHPALDQEAIRAIYLLPLFKPGVHHGKTVNVAYTIPINFRYPEVHN